MNYCNQEANDVIRYYMYSCIVVIENFKMHTKECNERRREESQQRLKQGSRW